MGPSRTVTETNADFGQKSQAFHIFRYLRPQTGGFSRDFVTAAWLKN